MWNKQEICRTYQTHLMVIIMRKKNQHLICQKEMKDLRHVLYITSFIKASATLRSTMTMIGS